MGLFVSDFQEETLRDDRTHGLSGGGGKVVEGEGVVDCTCSLRTG